MQRASERIDDLPARRWGQAQDVGDGLGEGHSGEPFADSGQRDGKRRCGQKLLRADYHHMRAEVIVAGLAHVPADATVVPLLDQPAAHRLRSGFRNVVSICSWRYRRAARRRQKPSPALSAKPVPFLQRRTQGPALHGVAGIRQRHQERVESGFLITQTINQVRAANGIPHTTMSAARVSPRAAVKPDRDQTHEHDASQRTHEEAEKCSGCLRSTPHDAHRYLAQPTDALQLGVDGRWCRSHLRDRSLIEMHKHPNDGPVSSSGFRIYRG